MPTLKEFNEELEDLIRNTPDNKLTYVLYIRLLDECEKHNNTEQGRYLVHATIQQAIKTLTFHTP